MPEDKKTETSGVSRRDLLHVLGTVPAAAVAAESAAHAQVQTQPQLQPNAETQTRAHAPLHSDSPAKPAAFQRKVFDDRQWHTVRVLCDLIIPADERSGSATAAGVPEFIDDWLDFRKQQDGTDYLAAQILGGLGWLDLESTRLFQTRFATASLAQQKQILDRIAWPARASGEDRRWVAFFTRFRDLTVSGFFSSKMEVADLPFLGNKAITEWKGCDPKVWAVIEERMKNGYKGLGGEVKPWTD